MQGAGTSPAGLLLAELPVFAALAAVVLATLLL